MIMSEVSQIIFGLYIIPVIIVYVTVKFTTRHEGGAISVKNKRLIFTPVINLFTVVGIIVIGIFGTVVKISDYYFGNKD